MRGTYALLCLNDDEGDPTVLASYQQNGNMVMANDSVYGLEAIYGLFAPFLSFNPLQLTYDYF